VSDWQKYEQVHGRDNTVTGTVVVWPRLASPQLGGARDILAYLPPSLAERLPSLANRLPELADHPDSGRRYPVVYFHDGQNVFDERTSFSGEWQADETLEQLAAEGIEAIAVAIPNGGEARMDEYNPWRDTRRRMGGKGDAYLEWVVGHVKPLVDRTLPTDPGRATTGICGSSMGGLISLYALAAYPDIFGLAAAMSPSLSWNDHRMVELVREGRVTPARIHVDAGGREWRGMLAEARRLRDLLLEQGFVEGRDLHYVEERSGAHRESAWARRLPDALRFLLAETRASQDGG
jgi:predicted alpha/beta superfamily hydrolase